MARPGRNDLHWRVRLPGLDAARGYQRAWLRGDLIAGVTVAAYLIPQVMAYAIIAGLPPVTGLWAALPPLLIYPLLGSSLSVSMGPEATTALMTAVAVGPLAAGDPARFAVLAASIAFVVGAFAVLAWLIRLGFVADMLSRPVLVGYLAGVALIMIASQLERVTGVPAPGRSFFAQVTSFARGIENIHPAIVAVAAAVLAFLFVVRWKWPRVPGPLAAVLLATLAVALSGLGGHEVPLVGPIPAGLPVPGLPSLHARELRQLVLPALSVLLVAFSDDVLTARSFARRGRRRLAAAAGQAAAGPHEEVAANQELLALGVCNMGASVLHGFPVSSSASRTAIGVSTGSQTQAYSLAALASVVGALLFLRPVLARFPYAALGGIVIYAAVGLIDIRAFRRLATFRRNELLLALGSCAGVLALNILYGVLLAIVLSVVELLLRVGRPHDAILGRVPGLAGMHNIDDYPQAQTIPGLVVYRYDAPLFFANAEDFRRRALAAMRRQGGAVCWFLLNVEANVEVDFTALEAVEAVRAELAGHGTVFALARVKQDLLGDLQAFGLADRIGAEFIFPTLPTAVTAYEQWVQRHRPGGGTAGDGPRPDGSSRDGPPDRAAGDERAPPG